MYWINTYLGPPNQIIVDAGKQFTSKEFAQLVNIIGIKVKIVPIEAYNSIGIVKYYYRLVRYTYLIIIAEIKGISKEIALQIAFKALNNTAGISRIVPTLLVYSALPQLSEYNAPIPTVSQRLMALKKVIAEI
jgi:hypothetical protein